MHCVPERVEDEPESSQHPDPVVHTPAIAVDTRLGQQNLQPGQAPTVASLALASATLRPTYRLRIAREGRQNLTGCPGRIGWQKKVETEYLVRDKYTADIDAKVA
jgi:hypothetical protein